MADCKNITVPTMVLLWVWMCLGGARGANFDVRRYGTRADGRSDDSGAMMHAWKDACASDAGPVTTFTIPPGNYLAGQQESTLPVLTLRLGNDCISFGDESQQVYVSGVTCGPGHGISVGSLRKFQGQQPVTGLTVTNCTLTNTMNGIRVKTCPASISSLASDLHFEHIKTANVGTPILIDQQYCPYGRCQLKSCSERAVLPPPIHSHTEELKFFLFQVPSRVKLSDIQGTSSTPVAFKLACSAGVPCQNVQVRDINLRYDGNEGNSMSLCSNVKQPRTSGPLFPPLCTAEVPAP